MISIITATYNSEHEILETYQSLAAQTYSDWEWLITDDCSSDNSYKLICELANKDNRIKTFKNNINSGAAVSRNCSLKAVQGEFIAFIDSDDLWHPEKLEKQLKFMGDDIHFSFTAYELIDAEGNKLNKTVDSNQSGFFTYNDMLKKEATLGCSTVMIRSSSFPDITMPLIRTGQDYATWLKLLKTGVNAYVLNQPLTQYRIMPNSISRNKFKKAKRQWYIYRKIEKLSLIYSLICFGYYAFRAVFRR